MSRLYHSQYQQDLFLDQIVFNGKRKGVFVDIGAYDGTTISNTLFFERVRDWKGICFEPNPEAFEKLIANRSCECHQVCIGKKDNEVFFTQVVGGSEMLSGVSDEYHSLHLSRIKKETLANGGCTRELKVQMRTLSGFLKGDFAQVDFVSIDTEGNELSILETLDFVGYTITAFVVENNYRNNKVREVLESKNYVWMARLTCDEVFVHRSQVSFAMLLRLGLFLFQRRMNLHGKGMRKRIRNLWR
ncbi:FkbM family methyltransferase [Algoriphagus sp. H41]|uniref:FkbM family methyltransferase n=1 Tax=Algoriphagus oliviformis TaxID=2811231 RepID=A0ABS3C8R4_9BACT|nr:FkbM family methyltransferase [Algoriphagus oliviformis]MBN7812951.1 FkbM family methyltransferase [Algoriphagus oliviformis]